MQYQPVDSRLLKLFMQKMTKRSNRPYYNIYYGIYNYLGNFYVSRFGIIDKKLHGAPQGSYTEALGTLQY